jgi:hypothetical protein
LVSVFCAGVILSLASATFSSSGWSWTAPDGGASLVHYIGSTVKVTFS